MDLGFNGYRFTWCNKREGQGMIRERIDRALGNTELREHFPHLQVFHLDPLGSDHHLLLVNCWCKQQFRTRSFKFESVWTTHMNYLATVRNGWQRPYVSDSSSLTEFVSRLCSCRSELTRWSKKEFPNSKKVIEQLKVELAVCEQGVLTPESKKKASEITAKIENAMDKEEQYWWQRSRINWLQAGDRNSRFFHLTTIHRRQYNSILRLKDDSGTWLSSRESISANISSFFETLFLPSGSRRTEAVLNFIEPKISEQMNLNLLLPVTREEIREAAFSLGSTKAPGPDGFSGKFYHSAWPEIGENICSMVQEFFAGNSYLHEINDTNVTLIPKIEKPDHVSHFRPIGLCNFSYKIISKIIASRMRPLLDACISQNQSAFIPGRLIHDNIIIAHEVYHYLRRKKKGNKYEFALKMDMSKAYDRVEWDFLELVLLKFGFCEDWVRLIMKCVNSVRLNLCVSGEKIGSISPGRGLRQGDPLSPYLFILVTEVLSAMITKSQMSKNLQGIKLSNSCPEISHCFFADDALFFMNANERNCTNLANILNQYCVVSGQSANLDKSSIFFSANTPEIIKSRTSGILGIQAMQDPGKYLGIPSVWGKTKHQALSYIRERVRNKIQGWTKSTLSFAGREVMIKSIINAIPIYPMNCFKFTIKACKELNSLIANFWWEGNAAGHKLHWKSWDSLTEAKCAGGMGFRDFTIANDALLAKTAWRLLNNPDDLWVRVLKSIYFPQGEFMDVEKGYKASWCWSSIIDGRDFLKKDLLWDLGDGSSIRIWEDRWVPDVQFPEKPVNNYDDILQHGRVCDLIVHGSWNLSPIRHLISDDLAHAIIQIPIPLNGLKDKIIWTPASNGNYSVKLGYRNAKDRRYIIHKPSSSTNMSPANWRSIWKLNIVPRVQHFVWRILNQVVATNDALFRRKRASSKLCPICDREEETVEHLFFHCPWTRCVWFGCHLGVKTDVIQVRNFTSWWLCITDVGSNFASSDITLICWILWFIWKQRNEKVFNLREPSPQFVIEWAMRSNLELCALNDVTDMNESISITDPDSVHWCFPPPGILKINCDGAYSSAMGTAAIGIICRNEYGDFVWGFADKIKSLSAFMTEALALKRALMLAVDLGHDKILFETDSQLLKSSVESQQPDLYDWKCRSIIQDIINLLASRVGFSLTFTPRRGNFAADLIAADAFKGVCPTGWVSQPSLSLSSILTLDAQKAGRHFDATASP